MDDNKLRIAITQGDANGIGMELIFKTFASPEMFELCTPIIYGSPKVAAYHKKALNLDVNFSIIQHATEAKPERLNLLAVSDEEVKIEFGTPSEAAAALARKAIDKAVADCKAGFVNAIVNAPISEKHFFAAQEHPTGLSQYIAKQLGETNETLEMSLNECLRITTLSGELAIKDVANEITKERIESTARLLHNSLRRDFMISIPRVAVLALNPTLEDQPCKEEQEVISPAIKQLIAEGYTAFGPYQADSFFGNREFDTFDGVLAMYHDQAMIPFKALSCEGGVRLITGLSAVVTSTDDEALDVKVGQGVSNEMAFRHAIYLALDVFRNRKAYDQPYKNPLKKLYHEKRDESDKVRFNVTKKKEGNEEQQPK